MRTSINLNRRGFWINFGWYSGEPFRAFAFFACADGWHLTLWRLQVYWLPNTTRYVKPWRLMRTTYWLRFAIEWT